MIKLVGKVLSIEDAGEFYGASYKELLLRVNRKVTGHDDIIVRYKDEFNIAVNDIIEVNGSVRTYRVESRFYKSRIKVYTDQIKVVDKTYLDNVSDPNFLDYLVTVHEATSVRITPNGWLVTEADVIYEKYPGKYDKFRVVFWGSTAEDMSNAPRGTRLRIRGNIHARPYVKVIEGIKYNLIAYEVSVRYCEKVEVN